MSLPELLHQVSAATSLQFRYATPPDAVVSASFQNAPLFPSLERALSGNGFSLLRDGHDAWVFRAYSRLPQEIDLSPLTPSKPRTSVRTKPPTSQVTGAAKKSSVRPVSSVKAAVGGWLIRTRTGNESWKRVALEADAREFPGVTVLLPGASVASEVALRYALPLRYIPAHLRLVLDTPRAAMLRVNGATLRREWHGRFAFEVSKALRPGLNSIEVSWRMEQRPVGWRSEDDSVPLLRYEWLSGNDPAPTGTSEAPLPGGFRLLTACYRPSYQAD